MNSKNKNIMLFICIFIVLVVFIDLIFNFSGILIENFTTNAAGEAYGVGSTSESSENSQTAPKAIDNSSVKSIVSKVSGRVLNVSVNTSDNSIITVSSPQNPTKANLTVNQDGTLSEEAKIENLNQQFELLKINNAEEYRRVLLSNNKGANVTSTCTKYPFYLVKSKALGKNNIPWCLAYDTGNLYVYPVGNYDNQKWDVSGITVETKSFCVSDMDNTSTGQLRGQADNPLKNNDKIKINLNLNDDLKSRIFGIDGSSASSSNQKCPTYLPKNSINSLCKGCDVDKL